MKNVVSEINGYLIHVEAKEEGMFRVYTYWTVTETGETRKWKTLRGAINWCEKNRT